MRACRALSDFVIKTDPPTNSERDTRNVARDQVFDELELDPNFVKLLGVIGYLLKDGPADALFIESCACVRRLNLQH